MSCKWPGFQSPPAQTFLLDHRWPLLLTASEMSLTSNFCWSVYTALHLNLLRNHKKIWKQFNATLVRHFCQVYERKKVSLKLHQTVSIKARVTLIFSQVLWNRILTKSGIHIRQCAEGPWHFVIGPDTLLAAHFKPSVQFPQNWLHESVRNNIEVCLPKNKAYLHLISRKRVWQCHKATSECIVHIQTIKVIFNL